MVKPSDLVRPPKPPPPCPTPEKHLYRSAAEAKRAHRRSYWSTRQQRRDKPKLYPYECVCGAWHLTHHKPKPRKATK